MKQQSEIEPETQEPSLSLAERHAALAKRWAVKEPWSVTENAPDINQNNLAPGQPGRASTGYRESSTELETLLETVRIEGAKRRKKRRWMLIALAAYVTMMVTLAIFTHKAIMLNSMGSMTGVIAGAYAASKKHKKATKELALLDEIRSVGPLAESLEFQDREIRRVSEEALIRLLPRLQASDASLLDTEQRASLNRNLAGKNANLTLAILQALEQVGDNKAIPFVEKLAAGKSRAGRNVQIREAAVHCLEFLKLRVQHEEERQTLLRGSSPLAADPAILLRAASADVNPVNPQELLRGGTNPNAKT